MVIKKLALSDLDALGDLDAACFDKPWTLDALAEELTHPDALCFGFFPPFEKGGLGGISAALLTRSVAGERWIFRIMTHPDYRRQGLAEKLLHALRKEPLWLEVSVLNTGAIQFYERAGFEVVGRRPGYYPEDALILKHV